MGWLSFIVSGPNDGESYGSVGDGNFSDQEIVDVIRGTGCEHIQMAMSNMSDADIVDLVHSGGADEVLQTIYDGTVYGYEAASSADNALDLLATLLHIK